MAGANGGASGGIKCHRRSAQQPETHPDFYVGDDFLVSVLFSILLCVFLLLESYMWQRY